MLDGDCDGSLDGLPVGLPLGPSDGATERLGFVEGMILGIIPEGFADG